MTIEKMPWGRSIEILEGPKTEEGRTIESAGVNYIAPGQMIMLHLHTENNEDYIPQTEGLRILVVSEKESKKMNVAEAVCAVRAMTASEIGDVITCPKGHAHALYNSSNTEGSFVFIKYN